MAAVIIRFDLDSKPRRPNQTLQLTALWRCADLTFMDWRRTGIADSSSTKAVSFSSARTNAVIRVYDEAGSVIETHKHKGDFREP